jgi:hypothetical protein
MTWIGLVLLGLVLLVLLRGAVLGTELFRVRVRGGEIELLRGRLPPALFDEIADVVRLHRVQSGEIRAVLSGGRPQLVFEHDGSSSAAEQPLRNVLGRFTLRQIRSGRRRGG